MILFTLQVGINQYHPQSKVPSLEGCANDVAAMRAFLGSHFPGEKLVSKVLLNEQATYRQVIKNFGEAHLLKAGKGDLVLFQYSGHGARARSASEFNKYYPDGLDETLVCYDSRIPGGLELADKELSVLISRIAARGAHVLVILDCCHSGSGTRGSEDFHLGAVRQVAERQEERPLDSYLDGYFKADNILLPNSRHMLLAACDKKESAFELTSRQGHFTYNLLKVLEAVKGKISYADLFTQSRIQMRKLTGRQNPQFETSGFFNAFAGFLELGGQANQASLHFEWRDDTWHINCGAVQGVPATGAKNAVFEVYFKDQLLGHAYSDVVGVEQSSVRFDFEAKNSILEKATAKMISIPAPPVEVELKWDEDGQLRLEKIQKEYRFVHIALSTEFTNAAYQMEVSKDEVIIRRKSDRLVIRTIEGNSDPEVFEDAFSTLESMAKWEKTCKLEHVNTQMDIDEVELVLVELDKSGNPIREISEPELNLDIIFHNGIEKEVPFRIAARNKNADKEFYGALYYLSESFGIHKIWNDTLAPNSETTIMELNEQGKPYRFGLGGKQQATDTFKLIVSKQKLSDYLLGQQPLTIGQVKEYWVSKSAKDALLDERLASRHLDLIWDEQPAPNDWFVRDLKVQLVARG